MLALPEIPLSWLRSKCRPTQFDSRKNSPSGRTLKQKVALVKKLDGGDKYREAAQALAAVDPRPRDPEKFWEGTSVPRTSYPVYWMDGV